MPYEQLIVKRYINKASFTFYCYNITYALVTLNARHNPVIYQILINHINAIIVMKLCQIKQHSKYT